MRSCLLAAAMLATAYGFGSMGHEDDHDHSGMYTNAVGDVGMDDEDCSYLPTSVKVYAVDEACWTRPSHAAIDTGVDLSLAPYEHTVACQLMGHCLESTTFMVAPDDDEEAQAWIAGTLDAEAVTKWMPIASLDGTPCKDTYKMALEQSSTAGEITMPVITMHGTWSRGADTCDFTCEALSM